MNNDVTGREIENAALIACFQKAFKLFGLGQSEERVDQFNGSIDGVLLLPVRWMAGNGLLLHDKKMTAHPRHNGQTKLSKARKQRRKQGVN
jgi:hypothetical protein